MDAAGWYPQRTYRHPDLHVGPLLRYVRKRDVRRLRRAISCTEDLSPVKLQPRVLLWRRFRRGPDLLALLLTTNKTNDKGGLTLKRIRNRRVPAYVAAIGALGVGLASASSAGGAPAADREPSISALRQPASSADALPEAALESEVIAASTSRELGMVDGTTLWAARGVEGEYCVVAEFETGADWVVGASCQTSHAFGESGVNLELTLLGDGVDIVLLPDGFSDEAARALAKEAPVEPIGSNALVMPLDARPDHPIEIRSEAGTITVPGGHQ